MRKSTLPKDSTQRQRRQRTYEQVRISELEIELQEAQLRVRLYSCALQVASDATGIDLVKKLESYCQTFVRRKNHEY